MLIYWKHFNIEHKEISKPQRPSVAFCGPGDCEDVTQTSFYPELYGENVKTLHFRIEIHLPFLNNNGFLTLRKEQKHWSWHFKLNPTLSVWKENKAEVNSLQGLISCSPKGLYFST